MIENSQSGSCLGPGPYHAGLLQEVVALARRLIFSEEGVKVTAQSLVERDLAAGVVKTGGDESEHLLNAIEEIRKLESVELMRVIIDPSSKIMTQVCDATGRAPKIFLQREVMSEMAKIEYLSTLPGASSEAQSRRYRHVLFLAIVFANDMQIIIAWMITKSRAERRGALAPRKLIAPPSPRVSTFVQRMQAVEYVKPVRGQPAMSTEEVRVKRARGGWVFERALFSGSVVRLTGRIAPDDYTVGITGLVVMVKEGEAEGYFQIRDEVIKRIVEGRHGWENSLPLNVVDHPIEGFKAGNPAAATYRRLDGTLWGRSYSKIE